MATGAPSVRHSAVPVRQRPSVSELDADQLKELRDAFAAMQQVGDERGYQYFAGLHGLPLPSWCDRYGHGLPTFLHWHRAYLWRFELALRDNGRFDVVLPWWDWVNAPEVPAAYADELTAAGDANPLYSVHINDLALSQGANGEADSRAVELSQFPDTFRQPGLPGVDPLPTQADIETVLDYSDFSTFTGELENWHGTVHIWTGGHMTDVPFAAYDPIFWAHHTMIDRLWRIWQVDHSGASLPRTLNRMVMEPFGITAEGTLEVNSLGYDYALSATEVRVA